MDALDTVMSYPPQCRVLLASCHSKLAHVLLAALTNNQSRGGTMAQLTTATVAAQLCHMQLRCAAGGSLTHPPDLVKQLGRTSFDKVLTTFLSYCTHSVQVRSVLTLHRSIK